MSLSINNAINQDFVSSATNNNTSSDPQDAVSTLAQNAIFLDVNGGSSWTQKTIQYLGNIEQFFDENLPDFTLQKRLDKLGSFIDKEFACLPEFHKWLDENNDYEAWKTQFAFFLIKLPIRSARNVIQHTYNIIHSILYIAVHPLKGATRVVKHLVYLIEELKQPINWSKIGTSIIGGNLGQIAGALSTNPLSVFSLSIGCAMLIAGISFDALNRAEAADAELSLENFIECAYEHAEQLPDAVVTSFLMGLILGGVQRITQNPEAITFNVINHATAQQWGQVYTSMHGLPRPDSISYSQGYVTLKWNHPISGWLPGQGTMRSLTLDPTLIPPTSMFRNPVSTNYSPIGIGIAAHHNFSLEEEETERNSSIVQEHFDYLMMTIQQTYKIVIQWLTTTQWLTIRSGDTIHRAGDVFSMHMDVKQLVMPSEADPRAQSMAEDGSMLKDSFLTTTNAHVLPAPSDRVPYTEAPNNSANQLQESSVSNNSYDLTADYERLLSEEQSLEQKLPNAQAVPDNLETVSLLSSNS